MNVHSILGHSKAIEKLVSIDWPVEQPVSMLADNATKRD